MTKNLICRLLSHRFGHWEYVSEGSCAQERTCTRYGFQEERLYHAWRIRYTKEVFERYDYDIRRFGDTLLIPNDEYWEGHIVAVELRYCPRCGAEDEHRR